MKIDNKALADEVVQAFTAKLEPELIERIGNARLEDLRLLVEEALAASLGTALGLVGDLVRELRLEAGKPEIEL